MKYTKYYFESLNYTNYLERRDRYLKQALELYQLLKKFCLINKESTILDYGSAVGFLMEGFKELGCKNVYGYDISKWANLQAKNKGLKILEGVEKMYFSIITCFDVLEHMTDNEIHDVFSKYESDIMIVRIPCSIDGKSFVLNISNRDQTHINCKLKADWVGLLSQLGYKTILPLNLLTIYDTPGVFCALCLKQRNYF